MFTKFRNWLKRRTVVSFYMKSGGIVQVRCEDVKITYVGNELRSYEFTNKAPGQGFYIRIDDISAISLD